MSDSYGLHILHGLRPDFAASALVLKRTRLPGLIRATEGQFSR
jgi:hypothetical protein